MPIAKRVQPQSLSPVAAAVVAVAVWFAVGVVQAGAQENFSAGKSAAQLFASDCTGSGCHRGPGGLGKNYGHGGLASFLREHYTNSRQSAAALADYLLKIPGAPAEARTRPAATPNPAAAATPNAAPNARASRAAARTDEPAAPAAAATPGTTPAAAAAPAPAAAAAAATAPAARTAEPAEAPTRPTRGQRGRQTTAVTPPPAAAAEPPPPPPPAPPAQKQWDIFD